jgi:hypothetical protein
MSAIEKGRVNHLLGNQASVVICDEIPGVWPAHAHRMTGDAGHTHGICDPGHAHTIAQLEPAEVYPEPYPEPVERNCRCVAPRLIADERFSKPLEMRLTVDAEGFRKMIAQEMARALGIPAPLLESGVELAVDPETEQRGRNLSTVAALYNAPCLPS